MNKSRLTHGRTSGIHDWWPLHTWEIRGPVKRHRTIIEGFLFGWPNEFRNIDVTYFFIIVISAVIMHV